jgi:hypothetical protein
MKKAAQAPTRADSTMQSIGSTLISLRLTPNALAILNVEKGRHQ